MTLLDTLAARLGYLKTDSDELQIERQTAYNKGYADGERDALHPLDPPLDVVLVMRDETIAGTMDADDYAELAQQWARAVGHDRIRSGCYWLTVDGQRVNRGLILSNITSIVGVPVTPKVEGDA